MDHMVSFLGYCISYGWKRDADERMWMKRRWKKKEELIETTIETSATPITNPLPPSKSLRSKITYQVKSKTKERRKKCRRKKKESTKLLKEENAMDKEMKKKKERWRGMGDERW